MNGSAFATHPLYSATRDRLAREAEGKRRPSVFLPLVARCSLSHYFPHSASLLKLAPSFSATLPSLSLTCLSLRLPIVPSLSLAASLFFFPRSPFLFLSFGTQTPHTGSLSPRQPLLSRISYAAARKSRDTSMLRSRIVGEGRTAEQRRPYSFSFCPVSRFSDEGCESRRRRRAHAKRITRWPGLYGRVNDRSVPLSAARRVVETAREKEREISARDVPLFRRLLRPAFRPTRTRSEAMQYVFPLSSEGARARPESRESPTFVCNAQSSLSSLSTSLFTPEISTHERF